MWAQIQEKLQDVEQVTSDPRFCATASKIRTFFMQKCRIIWYESTLFTFFD
jgi:hypothetical protein